MKECCSYRSCNAHEAGAIEFTGHKVLPLPQDNGKISAADLKDYLQTYYADGSYDHMVFPGMVYISHPTEYGTLYTKQEQIFPVYAGIYSPVASGRSQTGAMDWWQRQM